MIMNSSFFIILVILFTACFSNGNELNYLENPCFLISQNAQLIYKSSFSNPELVNCQIENDPSNNDRKIAAEGVLVPKKGDKEKNGIHFQTPQNFSVHIKKLKEDQIDGFIAEEIFIEKNEKNYYVTHSELSSIFFSIHNNESNGQKVIDQTACIQIISYSAIASRPSAELACNTINSEICNSIHKNELADPAHFDFSMRKIVSGVFREAYSNETKKNTKLVTQNKAIARDRYNSLFNFEKESIRIKLGGGKIGPKLAKDVMYNEDTGYKILIGQFKIGEKNADDMAHDVVRRCRKYFNDSTVNPEIPQPNQINQ